MKNFFSLGLDGNSNIPHWIIYNSPKVETPRCLSSEQINKGSVSMEWNSIQS